MDLVRFHEWSAPFFAPVIRVGEVAAAMLGGGVREGKVLALLFLGLIVFVVVRKVRRWFLDNAEPYFTLRMQGRPVVMAEQEVCLRRAGIQLEGRLDEVRELENGDWIVGDIKTPLTHRITQEDVIALSLYRYIIGRLHPDRGIRRAGYIRLVDPQHGKEAFVAVHLKSDAWIEGLIGRFEATAAGKTEAKFRADVEVCGQCRAADTCYKAQKKPIDLNAPQAGAAAPSSMHEDFMDVPVLLPSVESRYFGFGTADRDD